MIHALGGEADEVVRQRDVVIGALGCLTDISKECFARWQAHIPKPRNRQRDARWLAEHEGGLSYGQIAQKYSTPGVKIKRRTVEEACRREKKRREQEGASH
jgi:hypothetical protein